MKQIYIILTLLFVGITVSAQVDDNELINYQPEGELKFYERSGVAFYENESYKADKTEQDGETMAMVYAPDNVTVYIKDPVSKYQQGTWVRGTIDGNTITVPLGQNLKYQGTLNDTYMKLGILDLYDYTAYGAGYVAQLNSSVTEVTYTISGNTITLNGTDDSRILGVYWGDDGSWDKFGDSQSVYTLVGESDMDPVPVDPLVPVFFLPEGVFKPEVDFRITFKDIYDRDTEAANYTFSVYVKMKDAEPSLYNFDSELYGFDQDMIAFPLDFYDGGTPPHFGYNPSNDVFWLTFEDFTDEWEEVGIQLINTVAGTEYRSNVVYVTVPSEETPEPDAIGAIENANQTAVEYFDMQGRRINKPQNGLFIMRQGGKVVKVAK